MSCLCPAVLSPAVLSVQSYHPRLTARNTHTCSAAPPYSPKYFRSVRVSALAALKMIMHAHTGVQEGVAKGGKPLEIMGLMTGHVDPDRDRTLIVHDVFPLNVTGTETRVLADDVEVINFMIKLGEAVEETRNEHFCGWYHSHPFDVGLHSNCFLSSTDVSTQLNWQRAEDPAGNPWLAIVVDPLRSIAKSRPEFGAFRVYPPEFAAPANETPDGSIVVDDSTRVERWGSSWNRYHCLNVEYFMSSLSSSLLSILSRSFLWTTVFGSTPMLEKENREGMSERILTMAEALEKSESAVAASSHMMTPLDRARDDSALANPTSRA